MNPDLGRFEAMTLPRGVGNGTAEPSVVVVHPDYNNASLGRKKKTPVGALFDERFVGYSR